MTTALDPQSPPPNVNEHVRKWVDASVQMCRPDRVVWLDGSADERKRLVRQGIDEGVFIELNQQKLPGCYLHRSNPCRAGFHRYGS